MAMFGKFIYGFAEADEDCRPVAYGVGTGAGADTVRFEKYLACAMVERNQNVKSVWIVDNCFQIAHAYNQVIDKASIENYAIFKDLVERLGIRLL